MTEKRASSPLLDLVAVCPVAGARLWVLGNCYAGGGVSRMGAERPHEGAGTGLRDIGGAAGRGWQSPATVGVRPREGSRSGPPAQQPSTGGGD